MIPGGHRPEHLNTPRLIENQAQQAVWRWDQQEPFGNTVPDENPSGLGTFDLPLRLPGQYFDKETNLNYNYFRDYDPSIGRYGESDPIGLRGGINTYAYVAGNPVSFSDPTGELLPIVLVPALTGTGMSAGTGLLTTAGVLIGSGVIGKPGDIPTSAADGAANDDRYCPSDDDCAKRKAALEKRREDLKRQMQFGFKLAYAIWLFNSDVATHNSLCRKFPVERFWGGY